MNSLNFFKGCAKVNCIDGKYTPIRFTSSQVENLSSYNDAISMRTKCTAGVRLEFITNEKNIEFSFACDQFSRPHVVFDIWENDSYVQSVEFSDNTKEGRVCYTRQSKEASYIVIWFPHLVRTTIFNLNIKDASLAPTKKTELLFYGDSVTQGMTVPRPSFCFASQVATQLKSEIINLGIGGKKFNKDILDKERFYNPSLIFVAFGINDSIQELHEPCMNKNVPEFFESLRQIYPQTNICVILAPKIKNLCKEEHIQNNLQIVRNLTYECAKKHNCFIVDGSEMLPENDLFVSDDDHPNELGSNHMAQKLLYQIADKKMLEH